MNKGVLKNFSKFTGKDLCWSLSFNKVAVPGTGVFQRILHFFKSIFLRNTSGQLLLHCLQISVWRLQCYLLWQNQMSFED